MDSSQFHFPLEEARLHELHRQRIELVVATSRGRTIYDGTLLVSPLQGEAAGRYAVDIEAPDLGTDGHVILRRFPLDAAATAAIRPHPERDGFRLLYFQREAGSGVVEFAPASDD